MARRSYTTTVLAAALCAGALVVGSPPAPASARADAQATTLSKTASYEALVTTSRGVSLAMWTLDALPRGAGTTLKWAVRRPGEPWTAPKVMARWPVSRFSHGQPVLTTSSGHRVTAAWLDRRRRVVVEDWSPRTGWSRPSHVSGLGHKARSVTIASDRAGQVAVSWSSLSRRHPDRKVGAMVAVRRDGAWLVRRVGSTADDNRSIGGEVALGLDDAGAVTAAWKYTTSGRGTTLASRLPASATTWETPEDFGTYDDYYTGLAVQPDGSAMINPAQHDVFTRVGSGDWTDAGPQPFLTSSLTLGSGALVTWNTPDGVDEDPDGIAGPEPLASIGYPEVSRRIRAPQVFATSSDELVLVTTRPRRVLVSVRPDGGDWSAFRTVYTSPQRLIVSSQAAMTPSGHVTALLATRAPGSHVHGPEGLDAIDFDAG